MQWSDTTGRVSTTSDTRQMGIRTIMVQSRRLGSDDADTPFMGIRTLVVSTVGKVSATPALEEWVSAHVRQMPPILE